MYQLTYPMICPKQCSNVMLVISGWSAKNRFKDSTNSIWISSQVIGLMNLLVIPVTTTWLGPTLTTDPNLSNVIRFILKIWKRWLQFNLVKAAWTIVTIVTFYLREISQAQEHLSKMQEHSRKSNHRIIFSFQPQVCRKLTLPSRLKM